MSRYDRIAEMSQQPDGTYMVAWQGGGTKGHSGALDKREALRVRMALEKEGYSAHTGPCSDKAEPSEPEPTMGCCAWVMVGALAGMGALARVAAVLC